MSSASMRFRTKAYVCARYFLRPGKCFKYIDQRGEDATEHVYEVMALYPYCVLLRDTRNGVRTCPGYNTLSLMLRGSEVNEQISISDGYAGAWLHFLLNWSKSQQQSGNLHLLPDCRKVSIRRRSRNNS